MRPSSGVRLLSGRPLAGKRVLITSGRCEEPVDDIRVLTTRSSGKMGRALAYEAFRLGADVTIIHRDEVIVGRNIHVKSASSMGDAVRAVIEEKVPDIYISAAAVSDFAPDYKPGKIPSGSPVSIKLNPLPKLLDLAIGMVPVTSLSNLESRLILMKRLLLRGYHGSWEQATQPWI